MGEVAKEGRTVLFVSHNMQAIRNLCTRAILLNNGKTNYNGDVGQVIEHYLQGLPSGNSIEKLELIIKEQPPDPAFRLNNIELKQRGIPVFQNVANGEPLDILISYQVLQKTPGLRVYFDLCDTDGTILFRSFHDEMSEGISSMECGNYISKATIPADLLAPRSYELRIYGTIFNVRCCVSPDGIRIPISVERTGKSNQAYSIDPIRGKLSPAIDWVTIREY